MPISPTTNTCEQVFAMARERSKYMNYDVTLLSRAGQPTMRPLPTDIARVADHIGTPVARTIRWRQGASVWLHQLANRVAPRPVETECDDLFEAISALLAEPKNELSTLNSISHRGC
jgi:hypothetical protein